MALNQSWTEITTEMDLDDLDYGDADSINRTDITDKAKWNSSGTRNLRINYSDVSRNLSQSISC